jgi:hypothetical protein
MRAGVSCFLSTCRRGFLAFRIENYRKGFLLISPNKEIHLRDRDKIKVKEKGCIGWFWPNLQAKIEFVRM